MNNLKKARLARSITQDELAHLIGITVRTYQYIEHGKRKPSYDTILKLQDIFKCDINKLLSVADDI